MEGYIKPKKMEGYFKPKILEGLYQTYQCVLISATIKVEKLC